MVALVEPVDPVTTDEELELLDDALASAAVVVDAVVVGAVVVVATMSLGATSSVLVDSAAAAVSFEPLVVVSPVLAWRPSTPTSPTVDATASPVANLRARAAGWRRRRRRGRWTDGAATGRAAVGSGASCSSMRRTVRSGFVTTTWAR